MIIFLYGPDDYRREAKKREILAEFQKKRSDLGIGRFDLASEDGLRNLREFLVSQSLFQSAKMAIIDSAFEIEPKDLKKVLQEIVDDKNVTVLISEKGKPVKALDFLLQKPAISQKFEILEGRDWEMFIMGEAKRTGAKITPSALRFLAGVYQGNSWALVTELEKVGSLNKDVIDAKDFEDLGLEQAPNFWGLMMGFKSRNLEQRLWALEKVLGSNEPAAKIFNILAYQLPGRLGDAARYDLMVKSGKLEYEEVLVDLMI